MQQLTLRNAWNKIDELISPLATIHNLDTLADNVNMWVRKGRELCSHPESIKIHDLELEYDLLMQAHAYLTDLGMSNNKITEHMEMLASDMAILNEEINYILDNTYISTDFIKEIDNT